MKSLRLLHFTAINFGHLMVVNGVKYSISVYKIRGTLIESSIVRNDGRVGRDFGNATAKVRHCITTNHGVVLATIMVY